MITLRAVALFALSSIASIQSTSLPPYPFQVEDGVIKNSEGMIVDMQCVNWPGHMETNLPEGLQMQSLETIVDLIVASNLYNCVRLTYAVELLGKLKVTARESFLDNNAITDSGADLSPHIANFTQHNPELIDESLGRIFQTVSVTSKQTEDVVSVGNDSNTMYATRSPRLSPHFLGR